MSLPYRTRTAIRSLWAAVENDDIYEGNEDPSLQDVYDALVGDDLEDHEYFVQALEKHGWTCTRD